MKLPGRITVPRDVVWQALGDEVVLLHLRKGVYWNLNESGAVIWKCMQCGGSGADAVRALRESFTTTEPEAKAAVAGLIRELAKEGLLELQASAE